jgi:mono/diheme cytochrome c family protein
MLEGPDKALPATRERYSNKMPAFATWPDEDIAAVLTYVRRTIGKTATGIKPAQVAAARKK